jgi:hypothetical protein
MKSAIAHAIPPITQYKVWATNDWTLTFSCPEGQRAQFGSYMPNLGVGWKYDPAKQTYFAWGDGIIPSQHTIDPNAAQGCLLWKRIGPGQQPDQGSWAGESQMVSGPAGDYYFRINDDVLSDNSGYVIVSLQLYPQP